MSKYTAEQLASRVVQGDVILYKIDKLPDDVKKLDGKILQASEITGHHHHFVKDAPVTVYAMNTKPKRDTKAITEDEGKFIVVDDVAELFHGKDFLTDPNTNGSGDHVSQRIMPGVYEVVITREFDYDRMEASLVVD